MDDPPPNHLRFRDSAFLGRFGRFLPPFGRRLLRLGPPRAAGAGRGGGGRPGLDGHAHTACGRLGVGELEVPQAGGGGRHDLRPLDAHPKASASRRIKDLDRRVAGGRTHGRRCGLRRGRGRRQRVPGGRVCAPAGRRRRGRGCGCGCGSIPAAPEAPTWRHGRAGAGGPRAPTGGPGRATGGNAEATPSADKQRAGKRQRRADPPGARRRSHAIRAA
jgi:hypothetical protein